MMWEIVPRDEQETIINIDYYERTISIYTTRKSVAERLAKKVGKPTKVDKHNDLISGVYYVRNLFDEDVRKFFSKGLLIGAFRKQENEEEE